MKRLFEIVIVLLLVLPGTSIGQVLPFTHYSPESELNPLPSAEVHQVYQDRVGYIWFAIYSSGLVRYNGVNMEVYGVEDGLRDLSVWDLLEDSSGRLWVSSNSGLMVSEEPLANYDAQKRIKFTSEISNISLINVAVNHNRMSVDGAGWLWVGTESLGIVRYRFNEEGVLASDTLHTAFSQPNENIPVRSLVARKDGSVWASLLDGEIVKIDADNQTQMYKTGSSRSTNVLYETAEGELWGGEQNGRIWRLIEDSGKPEFVEFNSDLSSNISDITSDSEHNIWISSEGGGIQLVNDSNDKVSSYTRPNGLLSDIAYNVFEDRENNIWIAQSGGVSKLRYNFKAFNNLTDSPLAGESALLPSASVNTVLPSPFQSDPCALWAGTSEGGISCINNDFESRFLNQKDGLTSNWVNGLAFDSSGRLWIGTSRGINSIVFDKDLVISGTSAINNITLFGEKAYLLTYPASSVLSVVNLAIPNDPGSKEGIQSVWFPAYHRIYALVENSLYTLDESWGLPASIFHAAAFDGKGYLWVGTRDRGIYRSTVPIDLERVKEKSTTKETLFELWWSTEDGAPTNQIDNLFWDKEKMWVGTTDGLIALNPTSKRIIHNITTDNGLLANNATSIALSPETNTFWIGTNKGMAEIQPQTGNVLQTVTKADGLVDNEVWFYGSVKSDSSGRIYFGTSKGISIFDPSEYRINNTAPIVKLTQVNSDEIPGERNEFSFGYAALSFGNERKVKYQTRLLGFNEDWSAPKTEDRVNYTNLPAILFAKPYTFEVRAVNESGVWSKEPLHYTFSVMPVWWLRWWAFLGYTIILGMGVFAVDRIQRYRLIKREREAAYLREAELKAETAIARSKVAEAQSKALQAENELKAAELEKARELEKAFNELKSTQNRLIQAEKMASLGRLSTGIAHEIKNPLNFINNFAELSKDLVDELRTAIVQGDEEEIEIITDNLRFNTQKIEEHGKRADAIVRSMMQHSRSGSQSFEEVDLNGIVKEYADLAYNSKLAKNAAFDVKIIKELDSAIPNVKVIVQQIGQVLQNIIENAFDSVVEKKMSTTGQFFPQISIKTAFKESFVEVSVSDNGPGIPENIQQRIFEPFFTTKPTGQGTGLGLSISYDIVTQIHSGSLKVVNNPEGGAMFIIVLPISEKLITS